MVHGRVKSGCRERVKAWRSVKVRRREGQGGGGGGRGVKMLNSLLPVPPQGWPLHTRTYMTLDNCLRADLPIRFAF